MTSSIRQAWEAHCLPFLIEKACRSSAILAERKRWIPRAHGEVLEIGAGSGLNFAFYDAATVSRLVAVEPAAPLREKAAPRAAACPFAVELVDAAGEQLPFVDASFDSVVTTYTLCSVGSPAAVLGEMRRVLRPGGRLVFVEHGAAPDPGPCAWQRRITPLWRQLAGNCHLDRDVRADLADAGWTFDEIEAGYAEAGTRLTSFTTAGVARPTGRRRLTDAR